MIRLARDTISFRLANVGLKIVGDYNVTRDKVEFRCAYNHTFVSRINNILNRLRCPICHDNKTSRTIDEINFLLQDREIKMIPPYLGYHVNNKFEASCGHTWDATLKNVLSKTGCPYCSIKSFTSNRSATVYVLEFDNFIKYGISNNLPRRLMEHKNQTGDYCLVYHKEFKDGAQALRIENMIKTAIGGKFVSKDICPSGYTETLSKSSLLEVISIINKGDRDES